MTSRKSSARDERRPPRPAAACRPSGVPAISMAKRCVPSTGSAKAEEVVVTSVARTATARAPFEVNAIRTGKSP